VHALAENVKVGMGKITLSIKLSKKLNWIAEKKVYNIFIS
jgi:hypothetical protein